MFREMRWGGGKDAHVGRFEVEVGCPEGQVCCVIRNAYAEVAELVDLGRAWETVRCVAG